MARWNWRPDNPVFMDIETQSAVDLKKLGSRAYLRDASTRLLSAVYLTGNDLHVWAPESRLPRHFDVDLVVRNLMMAFPSYGFRFHTSEKPPRFAGTYVAHNAEAFDALAYDRFVPDHHMDWYDTMPACMACGLPAGLDAASRALGGEGKDDAGKKAMLLLTRAKGPIYPVGTQPLWELLLRYNIGDVLELRRVYEATSCPFPDFMELHTEINARGIPIDRAFARALKRLWEKLGREAKDRVHEVTEGALWEDDLYSPTKVKRWLSSMGFEVASLERKAIDAMIADPEGFFGDLDDERVARVVEVVRERQQSVRATPGKVDRVFIAADADDRVRGCYRAFGAFTGRFTARDLQPHNFPRGVKLDVAAVLGAYRSGTLDLQLLRDEAAKTGVGIGDALGTLMRPVIRAPKGRRLVVGDFGQVEARAVAWFSGDSDLLAAFADASRDIYCEMASLVFGEPVDKGDTIRRFIGKTTVLGCGYQMGVKRFGDMALLSGCNLEKAGTSAQVCVDAYRKAYPGVKRAWCEYQNAFRAVAEGSTPQLDVGLVAFRRDGEHVCLVLPNGRNITFRNVRVEPVVPMWGGAPVMTPTYREPYGFRKSVYGGLLMSYICQGSCSDILRDCMLALDYDVCMHVHDEIVMEVGTDEAEEALEHLLCVMSTPPVWAEGFPLTCEGFVGEHYTKSPLPGFAHGTGRGGKAYVQNPSD